MKKLLTFLLTAVMAVSLAACGGAEEVESSSVEIKDADEVITTIFEAYNSSAAEELPVVTVEGEDENFSINFCIPEDAMAKIDNASGMMHAMMANNFTASAVHVTDKADVENVITAITDNAKDTNWICGIPETLRIYTIADEYVVTVFGAGDILGEYDEAITSAYGDVAELSVEESLW